MHLFYYFKYKISENKDDVKLLEITDLIQHTTFINLYITSCQDKGN